MDLLAFFKKDSKIISLEEACNHLGVSIDGIYEPASDVKCVHLYRDSYFIIELTNGQYWTIVDRSDWIMDSLDEIEKFAYLALNLAFWYSEEVDPRDAEGMNDELHAFCVNHGYSPDDAKKLLAGEIDVPYLHRDYLNDFAGRLAKITKAPLCCA